VNPPLHLSTEILELRTRHPFRISRKEPEAIRTVLVRIRDADGVEGVGEATPQLFYGETIESVHAALARYAAVLGHDPFDLEGIDTRMLLALTGNASARAAVSSALHDLVGKRLGVPVYRMWGLDPATIPLSTFTIGIDTPEVIRQKVREAAEYPILKIKLGSDHDLAILEAIRSETDRELRVDANCGWTVKQAVRMLPVLEEFGVTVLEQPLPAEDLDGIAVVTRHSRIPVFVDESCHVAADIPRLAGRVDGVNLKLAKCGSLREAVRLIHTARAHQLMVMVGCMVESSVSITAAAQVTPLVDFVDLDGAALLAADPWTGATLAAGRLTLPTGPGLGVSPRGQ
jgi:L-alanine-DL-glutamate epimerase-like enolase superfamily enzyme